MKLSDLKYWIESLLAGRPAIQFVAVRGTKVNPSNRLLSNDCQKYVVTVEKIRNSLGENAYCLHHQAIRDHIRRKTGETDHCIGDHFCILISIDGLIQSCEYQFSGNDTMPSEIFSRKKAVGSQQFITEFIEQIGSYWIVKEPFPKSHGDPSTRDFELRSFF